jgi:hypothetical protein
MDMSKAGRVALDNMEIGEAFSRQLFGDLVEQGLRIPLGDIVLRVLKRDAHASAFLALAGAGFLGISMTNN